MLECPLFRVCGLTEHGEWHNNRLDLNPSSELWTGNIQNRERENPVDQKADEVGQSDPRTSRDRVMHLPEGIAKDASQQDSGVKPALHNRYAIPDEGSHDSKQNRNV